MGVRVSISLGLRRNFKLAPRLFDNGHDGNLGPA